MGYISWEYFLGGVALRNVALRREREGACIVLVFL
jgi:hypothetical protein